MASQKDALPYGARWGFRTPSPDFARTAVEPLSPPPASASPYLARAPSFSSPYAPPPVHSYSPQYPAMSRSFRGADPPPQLPQPSYAHGYMIPSPTDKQIQKPQSNPLDALADIALMHGASRLAPGPAYNPPTLPMPTIASPTFVAAAIPTPTWPRPDSAQPPVSPRAHNVAHVPAERRASYSTITREPSLSFGTIGQERRSIPRSRDHGNPSNADAAAAALSRGSPTQASPLLPAMQPEPAAAEAPAQATAGDPLSEQPKAGESRHPWINASPIDEYIPCPDDVDGHEHSITVSEESVQPVPNAMGSFLDCGKEETTSLPTPTQEDHVVANCDIPEGTAVVSKIQDSVANLTPESTEIEASTRATLVAEEPLMKNVEEQGVAKNVPENQPMVDPPALVEGGKYSTLLFPLRDTDESALRGTYP
jgi:hypothetical protein